LHENIEKIKFSLYFIFSKNKFRFLYYMDRRNQTAAKVCRAPFLKRQAGGAFLRKYGTVKRNERCREKSPERGGGDSAFFSWDFCRAAQFYILKIKNR